MNIPDDEYLCTSLGDFRELQISNKQRRSRKRSARTEKKRDKSPEARTLMESDCSTDDSSDDDKADPIVRSSTLGDDADNAFACMSKTFRHVIHQGGPELVGFLSSLKLQLTKRA